MYWTDLNTDMPRVEQANMDGTGRMTLELIDHQVKIPSNVAVDPENNWVYYADNDDALDHIIRFDGTSDVRLNVHGLEDVLGLAVHGEYLYWTDRGNSMNALVRAFKDVNRIGTGQETILEGYSGLYGLVAVNGSTQPCESV